MTGSIVEILIDGNWVDFPEGLRRAQSGDVFRLRYRDDGEIEPMGLFVEGDYGSNGKPYIVALDSGWYMVREDGDVCGACNVLCFDTIEEAQAEAEKHK